MSRGDELIYAHRQLLKESCRLLLSFQASTAGLLKKDEGGGKAAAGMIDPKYDVIIKCASRARAPRLSSIDF